MPAPEGNNNATIGRQARHALTLALRVYEGDLDLNKIVKGNGMRALVELWLKQLEKSVQDGDNGSANMIVDRMDGKAAQTIIGDERAPLQIVVQGRDADL